MVEIVPLLGEHKCSIVEIFNIELAKNAVGYVCKDADIEVLGFIAYDIDCSIVFVHHLHVQTRYQKQVR